MSDMSSSVELIPIESQTRTIQTCFQQCLYDVPNFQRPYSWTSSELEDFWEDAVLAQGDFFFGSTVTWVSEKRDLFNDTYSIIDGQQRLTTSAIALSVIRDAFERVAAQAGEIGGPEEEFARAQAATTQKYLVATDDDGRNYPVLKRPEPMFYERIQNPSAVSSDSPWNESAKRIEEARVFFDANVNLALDGLTVAGQIERLKSIRANILKARIIQVELASEEDGFLIFETLNTRGADLRLSDLVKNLLIRGGARESSDRQAIAVRWDRLAERVQDGRTDPDVVDRFIWQSWNSRRDAVKEPELFKRIGRLVGSAPATHLAYLEELETDSKTYEFLVDEDVRVRRRVNGERDAFAVPEFVDSVRALAIFGVTVANSTIMAVARKYRESSLLKRAQLIEAMRLVENFHFQFTALTSSGSTGGTRGRYNRFAVRLEAARSAAEVREAIEDLRVKLRASLPERALAEKAFRELFYAPSVKLTQVQKVRGRKVFMAYVLMAFAKSENLLPAGQSLESWSIEHIKPQSLGTSNHRDPVYSVGNLTLLTAALNGSLGDGDLPSKVAALRSGRAYFDAELRGWAETGVKIPTKAQIDARSDLLAKEAVGRVWGL